MCLKHTVYFRAWHTEEASIRQRGVRANGICICFKNWAEISQAINVSKQIASISHRPNYYQVGEPPPRNTANERPDFVSNYIK